MSASVSYQQAFRHEALLYAGTRAFLDTTGKFIESSLAEGEPILVVVNPIKIAGLQARLGHDAAARVQFADMELVGSNPARIIPAWRAFLDEHAGRGGRVRGIGEPIFPERERDELVECQHHEELLNVAFDGGPPWWLMCPYDTTALEPSVIENAQQTHPFTWDGQNHGPSTTRNQDIDTLADPLAEPETDAIVFAVDRTTLPDVRRFVESRAVDAGLDVGRARDLSLAAHEAATNSTRHGGGHGVLRIWRYGQSVICELRDAGRIVEPLVGRELPDPAASGGRGLWIVNQLCDLTQVRSSAAGTVVRMHMKVQRDGVTFHAARRRV